MCWRDQYRPLSAEDIRWNWRWNSARKVQVSDEFTFGPDEHVPERTVFHRILRPNQDDLAKTYPDLKHGTLVLFTQGQLSHHLAVFQNHYKISLQHFNFLLGGAYYPFQNRKDNPEPPTVKFRVIQVPRS